MDIIWQIWSLNYAFLGEYGLLAVSIYLFLTTGRGIVRCVPFSRVKGVAFQ